MLDLYFAWWYAACSGHIVWLFRRQRDYDLCPSLFCILCFWSSCSFVVLGGGNEALLTRRTGSAWAAIYFCGGSRSLVAELCFSSLRCLWLQRDASYASYGLLCRLWFDGPGFACNFVASPSVVFLVFVGSHCGFYRVVIGISLFLHFDQNASDCKRAHVV